ncbi:OmpW/AlkL family protein [Horticoccus sp. 23ND18S-11]|uniref:OmpW/AlkL family protein n=1 Tax=Horticoccus sp. 23ND18S-11 TaxID=3391832 RepID=UPI0039C9D582
MNKSLLLKGTAVAAMLFASLASPASAATSTTGPWTARVRATYLQMADKSDAFSALGINFAKDSVTVNSKWIPEFDFSYALTPNISAELVLTIPQSQEVTLAGVGKLGKFKHLPPTLMGQYRFSPGEKIQPYVGVGLNFTLIYDTDLKVTTVPLGLENLSIGLAAQAGCDIDLGSGMYLNFDVKRAALRSDVSVKGGPKLTTAKLDPWLYSIGLGWRF